MISCFFLVFFMIDESFNMLEIGDLDFLKFFIEEKNFIVLEVCGRRG